MVTLETSQNWLRMLVCHMALYREAVFTVRVTGVESVTAVYPLHFTGAASGPSGN